MSATLTDTRSTYRYHDLRIDDAPTHSKPGPATYLGQVIASYVNASNEMVHQGTLMYPHQWIATLGANREALWSTKLLDQLVIDSSSVLPRIMGMSEASSAAIPRTNQGSGLDDQDTLEVVARMKPKKHWVTELVVRSVSRAHPRVEDPEEETWA